MSSLIEKITVIGNDTHNRTSNMSEVSMTAADAAMNALIEVVDTAVDDQDLIDMEKLAGVRLSASFFSQMIDAMAGHTAAEVMEAIEYLND